jgi:hypothetical protein
MENLLARLLDALPDLTLCMIRLTTKKRGRLRPRAWWKSSRTSNRRSGAKADNFNPGIR